MKTPRAHQTAAVKAVFDAFQAGIDCPLINACVGSGKSLIIIMIAQIAAQMGLRALSITHVRELVEQVVAEAREAGMRVGVNAAAIGERTWRGQFIVAAIQSVFRNGRSFGPIDILIIDEVHLVPHGEMGMYRQLIRDLGVKWVVGLTGTPFRLQGGSLTEGEGALFQQTVYTYSPMDGIRDGYLVPPFTATINEADKIDPSRLKVSQGDYTGSSQDAQMIALMDAHLVQMRLLGADRQRWLVFEASTKAAKAMTQRMNEWGIPTGLVLGTTPARERVNTIAAYRAGRLRALVNVAALTTGFDVQEVDMLVMRRRTMSLGLFIQMIGRGMRTIGGNIERSIAAGKSDCLVLDYAGLVDLHGPIDLIRPKETKSKLVSCDACAARVPAAAMRCWSCDAPMTKNCPACLEPVQKGVLDCPHCGHDMRVGGGGEEAKPAKLLERPSGAALIASYRTGSEREGGWQPVQRVWQAEAGSVIQVPGSRVGVPRAFEAHIGAARWIRMGEDGIDAVLVQNGRSQTSVLQVTVTPDGEAVQLPVPMPRVVAGEEEAA
jgi:DNA repair protein RadD